MEDIMLEKLHDGIYYEAWEATIFLVTKVVDLKDLFFKGMPVLIIKPENVNQ